MFKRFWRFQEALCHGTCRAKGSQWTGMWLPLIINVITTFRVNLEATFDWVILYRFLIPCFNWGNAIPTRKPLCHHGWSPKQISKAMVTFLVCWIVLWHKSLGQLSLKSLKDPGYRHMQCLMLHFRYGCSVDLMSLCFCSQSLWTIHKWSFHILFPPYFSDLGPFFCSFILANYSHCSWSGIYLLS